MINYTKNFEVMAQTRLSPWLDVLPAQVSEALDSNRWGDLPKWFDALNHMPFIHPRLIDLSADVILIGAKEDCDEPTSKIIKTQLRRLHPWRKGPFDFFGVYIDTEWRSDFKWNRLKDQISPLEGRLVLDIGCGNGYHCWRMAGLGAALAIGIDPTALYVFQYQAVQSFVKRPQVSVLPIGVDDMPKDFPFFDTVFSMGILYHRKSPIDHLLQLQSFLREGGELVLETLVIEGGEGDCLAPTGRYAMMPNVRFIPSVLTLESWLTRVGFKNVRLVHSGLTTTQEQRSTDWMNFQSLKDFLNPADPKLTVEGYPAPQRAIFIVEKS